MHPAMRALLSVIAAVSALTGPAVAAGNEDLTAPVVVGTAPLLSPGTLAIAGVVLIGGAMLRARSRQTEK